MGKGLPAAAASRRRVNPVRAAQRERETWSRHGGRGFPPSAALESKAVGAGIPERSVRPYGAAWAGGVSKRTPGQSAQAGARRVQRGAVAATITRRA